MSIEDKCHEINSFLAICEIDDDEGYITSPILYSVKNASDNIGAWYLRCGVIDSNLNSYIAPSDYAGKDADIGNFYTKDTYQGVFWTEYYTEGTGADPTVSAKTYITDGKNVGKASATNVVTQCLFQVVALYKKEMKKGKRTNRDELVAPGSATSLQKLLELGNHMVFPMLLHNAKKYWHKVTYPCYVQKKYDGFLMVAVGIGNIPGTTSVDGSSTVPIISTYLRKREECENMAHVQAELLPVLGDFDAVPEKWRGIHLVGEGYKHGHSLQEIAGAARRLEDSSRGVGLQPDFMVFDCFFLEKPKMPFSERLDLLISFFDAYKFKFCKLAETKMVNDKNELDVIYKDAVADGYEGLVIRVANARYEFGISSNTRSFGTLKYKPRDDAEYPIVGFGTGENGKAVGEVMWICAENEEGLRIRGMPINTPLSKRKTFRTQFNQTQDVRYRIYNKLKTSKTLFDSAIKGQMLTVSYHKLSEDGIPTQPKGERFRDENLHTTVVNW